MKVSEVTVNDLADFIRLDDPTDIEKKELERMRESAVAYIKNYTGLEESKIDEHPDITDALFVLVTDMFDNRNYISDSKSGGSNKTVDSILNMHSVNLL